MEPDCWFIGFEKIMADIAQVKNFHKININIDASLLFTSFGFNWERF